MCRHTRSSNQRSTPNPWIGLQRHSPHLTSLAEPLHHLHKTYTKITTALQLAKTKKNSSTPSTRTKYTSITGFINLTRQQHQDPQGEGKLKGQNQQQYEQHLNTNPSWLVSVVPGTYWLKERTATKSRHFIDRPCV